MRMFTEDSIKTYKTQATAIAKARVKLGAAIDDFRWVVGVNELGRFHVIFVGEDCIHLAHSGFCVTF